VYSSAASSYVFRRFFSLNRSTLNVIKNHLSIKIGNLQMEIARDFPDLDVLLKKIIVFSI